MANLNKVGAHEPAQALQTSQDFFSHLPCTFESLIILSLVAKHLGFLLEPSRLYILSLLLLVQAARHILQDVVTQHSQAVGFNGDQQITLFPGSWCFDLDVIAQQCDLH